MAASMEELEWIQEFMDMQTNLCKWRECRALGLYVGLYIFLWVGKVSLWKLREGLRPQSKWAPVNDFAISPPTGRRAYIWSVCDVPIILWRYIFFFFFFGQFKIIGLPFVHRLHVKLENKYKYTFITLTVFMEICFQIRYIWYQLFNQA